MQFFEPHEVYWENAFDSLAPTFRNLNCACLYEILQSFPTPKWDVTRGILIDINQKVSSFSSCLQGNRVGRPKKKKIGSIFFLSQVFSLHWSVLHARN